MKNLTKFLHSAKKMEARQVARKAQDAEEVYTFDLQREASGCHRFEQILDDEATREKIQDWKLEPIFQMEEDTVTRQNQELAFVEAFESDMKVSQQHAPGNPFDTIAEIQGFDIEEKLYGLKQLPADSPDVFDNDLTDLTEHHLQEELSQNKQAVIPWKDKVRTALIDPEDPVPTQEDISMTELPDEYAQELAEEQIRETLNKAFSQDERSDAKSASSAFYIRSVASKER